MVKFLHDEPADEDFFGPHSKIASAVLEAICSDKQLRVVGLVGGWGSGKSTVVRQLSLAIPKDDRCKNYIFFEYDAWLSQNDPPRRAFMEAIIGFLIGEGVLERDAWEKRLDKLRGRIQDSIKTTTPILTWKSVVFLKSYIGLAAGIFLLNKLQLDKLSAGTATPADIWVTFAALALISLAPLAMIAIHLRETLIEKLTPDRRSVVPRLLNKSIESTRETTTKQPEPSSIEFRDAFRDIMIQVGSKKKRLLIVLDNLDRLSDEEALGLWSSMRSFFVDRLGQDFVENAPVVLVPVDIGSLTRLFTKTTEDAVRAAEIAKSYIEKTFDVTFEVREPVITDWRRYFDQSFAYTVGDLYASWDIHHARRLYESYLLSHRKSTTPRQILRLANSVAAFAATAVSSPPLSTVVLYALNEEEIQRDLLGWLHDRDYSEFDSDWKLNVAALHFMVERGKAIGPLLKDEIVAGILDGEATAVDTYVDVQGLGDLVAEIAHDPPADDSGRIYVGTIATVAEIIEKGRDTIHGSVHWADEAERNLAAAFLCLNPDSAGINGLAQALKLIVKGYPNKQRLIDKSSTLVAKVLAREKLSDQAITYIAETIDAIAEIAETGPEIASVAPLEVPGATELALAKQFAIYQRLNHRELITGPSERKGIELTLAKWIQDSVQHFHVPKVIRMLATNESQRLAVSDDFEKSPLVATLDQLARDPNRTQFHASAFQAALEILIDNSTFLPVVRRWADEGILTARFDEAVASQAATSIWAVIALTVASETYFATTTLQPWPDTLKSSRDVDEALASLARMPVAQRRNLLWQAIAQWPSARGLLYIMRDRFLSKRSPDDFDVPAILKDYKSTIVVAGRSPFLNLLSRSSRADDAFAQLTSDELLDLLDLPNISTETRTKLFRCVVEKLSNATTEQWSAWIQDDSRLFGHWAEFQKLWPTQAEKRSGLYLALMNTAGLAAANKVILNRWLRLLNVVASVPVRHAKVALLRELADQSSASAIVGALKQISPSDAEIRSQTGSWRPLLAKLSYDQDGRSWIDDHEVSVVKLVKSFTRDDRQALRSAVEHLAEDKREGRRLWAEKTIPKWFK